MRLPTLLRRRGAPTQIGGLVRLDRRTKNLTKRLLPGEIAVIHHADLDRVSAEALVETGVAAVVNAVPSVSGRYPNLGPGILMDAGIPLIDDVGDQIFATVQEGDLLTIDGGRVLSSHGTVVANGTLYTTEILEEQLQYAREGLSDQIEAFADNTLTYLREEKELLLEGVGVPEVATEIEGRHVLIVVRGYDYRSDLDALRPYITEYRPLLMGVDGGADALIEAGYKPDMIIGDMDSCSDETLRCGAELVVHAYHDGRAPGLERITALGLQAVVFPALGTSEDAAMLLADSKGARLLVAVGTHASLVEFLDKGRAGMASTFLTRLRVGPKLVDAKGVSRLYRSQIRTWHLVLLVLSGLLALLTALLFTDVGSAMGSVLVARIRDVLYWVAGLFT
ncbi:MAG TPA: putative cytokinetic ring protein SteA [Propionibacteriaceae bacterium]|nr:putative cytokinetic ring protein SteA [Propionibacteriaceae bacterium]